MSPDSGPLDSGPPDAAPRDAGDAAAPWDLVGVTVGGDHACVLWGSGRVSCWGRNEMGQLGNGTTTNSPYVTDVIELSPAVSVAAYDRFTCAITQDTDVSCWGSTDLRRLGSAPADPDPPWLTQPVRVPVVTDAVGLSQGASAAHACALTSSWLYCWGANEFAQLAQGASSSSAGPEASIGGCCPVSAAGAIEDGCIVNEHGFVGCSGASLGNGQQGATSVFTTVPGIDDARAVGTGVQFGCVLRMNGTVACWGTNGDGNLGDGTEEGSVEPVAVEGLEGVTKLAVGAHHACALLDSGTVSCWGKNLHGQLGNGTTEQANRPVAVSWPNPEGAADLSTPDNVIDIGAGNEHTCALMLSNQVWCWGSNLYGQLGANAKGVQSPWPSLALTTVQ